RSPSRGPRRRLERRRCGTRSSARATAFPPRPHARRRSFSQEARRSWWITRTPPRPWRDSSRSRGRRSSPREHPFSSGTPAVRWECSRSFKMPLVDLLAFGLAGALTGALGALLGLGGGVFLVPLLALGFGVEPRTAVAASLVAVVPSSSTATMVNMRRGLVNIPLAFTLLLTTSVGSFAGSNLAHHLSTRALYAIFGATLFVVSIVEI